VRLRIEAVALGLVVLAVVPYVVLKLAWLNGSGVGVVDGTALAELHSTRMVVGNNVTIVLEVAAVGLALALASAWGRRLPVWIVRGLGAGATGLLAPILLGLSIGSVLPLASAAPRPRCRLRPRWFWPTVGARTPHSFSPAS
jgi:hypothetical protein